MSELIASREDLAAALRAADRHGFGEGVCNHFSVAVRPDEGGADRFLINPNRRHWSEVTASSLVLLDDDGEVVEGDGPPEPTAFYIHWRIHKQAPAAHCVLHTHMPWATALTMLHEPQLLPLSQTSLMFHGLVAYDLEYAGLALDEAEGDRMATALGDRAVLFLANHGVIVTGATVAQAWLRLYYLERACMHQVMAMSTGRPLRLIDHEVASRTVQQIAGEEQAMADDLFDAEKRLLDRESPGWRD
jgi:ribulose-5-phosphate 4-epimerase/fuculose-1-phosphate aldolase